ncbi:MAG: methyltransferase domain-containing protein [Proteobacteria bacterium]|nr:methyltransferase domain-containing protein [Pseudomonadota bacterium]
MKYTGNHWDTIFSNTEYAKLGWYEKDISQTLKLLNKIPAWEKSTIFISGAGTSILIDELFAKGVKLVLNDISIEALNQVKNRLNDKAEQINWLCQNITQPIQDIMVDIWIDRAVLHFLTEESDIKRYFKNVKSTLKPNGYAIFAEFSKVGASKCAGLTLQRYSVEELSERLGSSFQLISYFDYTYTNYRGEPRPYIYAMYKIISNSKGC